MRIVSVIVSVLLLLIELNILCVSAITKKQTKGKKDDTTVNTASSKATSTSAKTANATTTAASSAAKYEIDYNLLPRLEAILEEINLKQHLKQFVRIGITDTRRLIKLNEMDFRLIPMEIESVTDADVSILKKKIEAVIKGVTVYIEPKENILDTGRHKLTYGRIYINNSVQSYEYISASFGTYPPIGSFPLLLASPSNEAGCIQDDNNKNLTGCIYVVKRGNCSFLQKAQIALKGNATVLLIVNNEDKLNPPSSGYGIDHTVKDADLNRVKRLPIISTSNTSWASFQYIQPYKNSSTSTAKAHIIPLRCNGSSGNCAPVTEVERPYAKEHHSGKIKLTATSSSSNDVIDSQSYDFLSSTFGSVLPSLNEPFTIVLSDPIDACTPIVPIPNAGIASNSSYAVIANRGNCKFDTKASIVQTSYIDGVGVHVNLLIIIDINDASLQRLGGMQPLSGTIGIPVIIVTLEMHSFLTKNFVNNNTILGQFIEFNNAISDDWMQLSLMNWSSNQSERRNQMTEMINNASSTYTDDIRHWLSRRLIENEEYCD